LGEVELGLVFASGVVVLPGGGGFTLDGEVVVSRLALLPGVVEGEFGFMSGAVVDVFGDTSGVVLGVFGAAVGVVAGCAGEFTVAGVLVFVDGELVCALGIWVLAPGL